MGVPRAPCRQPLHLPLGAGTGKTAGGPHSRPADAGMRWANGGAYRPPLTSSATRWDTERRARPGTGVTLAPRRRALRHAGAAGQLRHLARLLEVLADLVPVHVPQERLDVVRPRRA